MARGQSNTEHRSTYELQKYDGADKK